MTVLFNAHVFLFEFSKASRNMVGFEFEKL
jgi:hypothetical protein